MRLNKKFRPFKKGYLPGWTEEVFLVKQIYTTKPVVACVASVSNRVIGRKLERKQKKG